MVVMIQSVMIFSFPSNFVLEKTSEARSDSEIFPDTKKGGSFLIPHD